MKQIKVYTVTELKKKFPEAFETAHKKFQNSQYGFQIPWSNEIMDSLKAVFEFSGINLKDWSISTDSRSYVKFDMEIDTKYLSGNRALAWLENNLFYKLRENRPFNERVKYYSRVPYNFTHYGKQKDCPLTGYCADDDFLDSLLKEVKSGSTLEDAYHNLADEAAKMFENEYEYMMSEEYFIECSSDDQFTKDGVRI